MSEEDAKQGHSMGGARETLDEQISALQEAMDDVGRNVSELKEKLQARVTDEGDAPSSAEVLEDLKEVSLDNAPSTTSLAAGGAVSGGAVAGPGGAFIGAVAGAGIGFYRDLDEDRVLLAVHSPYVPEDVSPVPIDDERIQSAGAIEHTVKGAVDSDIDMDRAKNTITRVRDFESIENSLAELPSTSVISESSPDATFVEYDDEVVAVWLEENTD